MNDGESKVARGPGAGREGWCRVRLTATEHLEWILERIGRTGTARIPIAEALGAVLAEDARSRVPLPLWDNSAMDGYALRAADVSGADPAHPIPLRVVGEVLAGSADDPGIPEGAAVRIMTGAPVPADADAVLPVEATEGDRADSAWAVDEVLAISPVAVGAHIRRRGEDAPEGAVIAAAGDRLGAARIAALAAAGVDRVLVARAPRVAVLATGSELRDPGDELARGQIPESNSLLISGMLREVGIEPALVRRSADDAAALASWFAENAARYDCIITTGGVGPGTHDVVRIALAHEPGVRSVRVAVRPGQPQSCGRLGGGGAARGAFVFGLPGNPVSAAVSFELFVRPALLRMQGAASSQRPRVPARAATAWRGRDDRLQVLPVVVARTDGTDPVRLSCAPAVDPGSVSHSVGGHGAADGYALVPEGVGDVAEGDIVDVILVQG